MATQRTRDTTAQQLKTDINTSMRTSSRSKERTTQNVQTTNTSGDPINTNITTTSSTLHVVGSSSHLKNTHPSSTIASLTNLPTAPLLTTDNRISNNSINSQSNSLSSSNALTTSMQNPPNLTNVGTGIVPGPPPIHSQQPFPMQSTTPSVANGKDEMRGWLYKWTNYLKGYQKRWFVLQAGILSYYRSQDEMTHTCRGTIYLESAHVSSNDACHFVISNGSTVLHLRTSTESDKQRWMNALELAKQKALKVRKQYHDSDEDVSAVDDLNDQQQLNSAQQQTNINEQSQTSNERAELATMNKTFDAKLEDLKMCMDLINRHYQALYRTLADLEQMDKTEATLNTIKSVNERATLFRITATAMLNACQELVQLIQNQGRKWQKAVQFERDARLRMERMCEQVASQTVKLEKQMQRASRIDKQNSTAGRSTIGSIKSSDLRGPNESDDDEFYDAIDDPQTIGVFRIPLQQHASTNDKESPNIVDDDASSYDEDESESEEQDENKLPMVIVKAPKKDETQKVETAPVQGAEKPVNTISSSPPQQQQQQQQVAIPKRKRRDRIPERPNYSINLWSIMKNCVGKDLSKIPIPVNFSEPISMLQRMTEELEYSSVLDIAAKINDSWEQLAYVAAFTVSSYSTTATRVNKPFNPLLGETYECDRTDDLGWKSLAEQVSHHPPALSTYAEGQGWTLYQEFTMTSKFRGQYLSITPLGYSHLIFKNTGNHFTWRKVTTLVNNIIVGKLWIDNVGEMDIINHTTKDVCKLKYFPYSYFSKDVPRKVTGVVTDVNGQARWVLTGTWTEKMEGGPVESTSGRHAHSHHMETRNMKLLWQRKMPPAYLENMYNFTQLAIELNEDEPNVAPTDSRRRPDQRLMEEGRWDEANQEKLRLEEKQRQSRRARESSEHDTYTSKWFKKQHDSLTDSEMHIYTNEYWECKQKQEWSRCEDIF